MLSLTRRYALAALAAGASALGLSACIKAGKSAGFSSNELVSNDVFQHGVASGDPLETGFIIWTHVTSAGDSDVLWDVARDENFDNIIKSGRAQSSKRRDFTVKVDVTGLAAGQTYFYKFTALGETSPIGRAKTLANGALEQAKFAVVSCANFQAGYFNVYDHISRDPSYDAVLHLGDYFYEYGVDGWGGSFEDESRLHKPAHEIVSLSDYRMRHAQYRTDPSLQTMTAAHSMIAIWDDHESADDSYASGAGNHQPETEGVWKARRDAALQAYYEWMPVREPELGALREARYRSFSYGDLLTLVCAETRLNARAPQVDIDKHLPDLKAEGNTKRFDAEVLREPGRHMMGDTQMDFLTDALAQSKAKGQPWRLMANQVIMGKLRTPDLTPHVPEDAMLAIEPDWAGVRDFVENSALGLPVYVDSWDGYAWAREVFFKKLEAAGVRDIVVLTGDAHEYWVNDLRSDDGTKMGVELGVTSVTSPTLTLYLKEATADYALLMTQSNADARYYNPLHNGYMDVTVTPKSIQSKFHCVDTVTQRDYEVFQTAGFTLLPSQGSVKVTAPKGLNLKQRALFSGLG